MKPLQTAHGSAQRVEELSNLGADPESVMAAILTTAAWAAAKQHSHLRAETVVRNASSSQSGDEDSVAARGPKLEKKKASKGDDHNAHTKRVQPTSKQQVPDGTPTSRTPTLMFSSTSFPLCQFLQELRFRSFHHASSRVGHSQPKPFNY